MDVAKKNIIDPFVLAPLLLRIGLGIVFLYPAIASFIEPNAWIGYLPIELRKIFSASVLLNVFSAVQILLSLWLFSGRKILYASVLSALLLLGIIITNLGAMDIIFRDFAILSSALALAVMSFYNESK